MYCLKTKFNNAVSRFEAIQDVIKLRQDLADLGSAPSDKTINDYAWKYNRCINAFIRNEMVNKNLFDNQVGHVSLSDIIDSLRKQDVEYSRITSGIKYNCFDIMKSAPRENHEELKAFIRANRAKTFELLEYFLMFNHKTLNPLMHLALKIKQM